MCTRFSFVKCVGGSHLKNDQSLKIKFENCVSFIIKICLENYLKRSRRNLSHNDSSFQQSSQSYGSGNVTLSLFHVEFIQLKMVNPSFTVFFLLLKTRQLEAVGLCKQNQIQEIDEFRLSKLCIPFDYYKLYLHFQRMLRTSIDAKLHLLSSNYCFFLHKVIEFLMVCPLFPRLYKIFT